MAPEVILITSRNLDQTKREKIGEALWGFSEDLEIPLESEGLYLPEEMLMEAGLPCDPDLLDMYLEDGRIVIEPLEDGKGADAGALPHHRHHARADVGAVDGDDLYRQPLPLLEALGKGDVGEHLGGGLAHHQVRAGAGDLLRVAVAGKDLALLVDAHHAVLQRLH